MKFNKLNRKIHHWTTVFLAIPLLIIVCSGMLLQVIFGGDFTKLGLLLPTGIALFLMWLTGLWMFILPYLPKRQRKRALGKHPVATLQPGRK